LPEVQLGEALGPIVNRGFVGGRRRDPGPADVGVDQPAKALLEESVGALEVDVQVRREGHQLAVGPGQVTGERHALGRVLAQVGVMASAVSGHRRHRVETTARVGKLVGRRQAHSVPPLVTDEVDEPAEDVAPAVPPGDPARRSNRDVDAATRLVELLGQLQPGLAGADHQHRPLVQRGLVSVLVRVKLGDPAGDVRRHREWLDEVERELRRD
jgi:hypothetical protein